MKIDVKDLIVVNDENVNVVYDQKCDKYDYLTAVGCGVIGGIIDIFLVGAPGDSILGKWTDKQVDNVVITFAKHMGWNPKQGNENNVKSAIGFLEREKGVNYDQRTTRDVGNKFTMSPGVHHMMSISHSPDVVGLFFSILNQFTSTSSFIANGQLITIDTEKFELQGGNLVSKLFCGVVNWFGHIMSDIAGSSGSVGRGTGIVMPFYELFGFCKFGSFSTDNGKKDIAELATQAFNQGYDFRFGLAQTIPVIVTDLLIRLIWSLRQRFQYRRTIRECIPSIKYSNLRMMLLLGSGTLCVLDLADAIIRSGGNALTGFMRLNLVAWYRLVMLVLKEVFIRLGIASDIDLLLESYQQINEALNAYLKELETIDLEAFKVETDRYNQLLVAISGIKTEEELNTYLISTYESLNIEPPWEGDFNEFMSDNSNRLVFK